MGRWEGTQLQAALSRGQEASRGRWGRHGKSRLWLAVPAGSAGFPMLCVCL